MGLRCQSVLENNWKNLWLALVFWSDPGLQHLQIVQSKTSTLNVSFICYHFMYQSSHLIPCICNTSSSSSHQRETPEQQCRVDVHGFPTQANIMKVISYIICILKVDLSKYDHHFAIKLTFNCKSHDLKMCTISKSKQLPILLIMHLMFMIGLN